jgi:phosphate uptake regulator
VYLVNKTESAMTVVTAAELARDIERILDLLEKEGEEVVIVRDDHRVARLVPEVTGMTASEFLDGLYGILSGEEAEELLSDIREMREAFDDNWRDPWE